MINIQNFFTQLVKKDSRTFDNIWKIVIGQGDDYTTCCLLHNNYVKVYCKMITMDLSN